MSTALSHAGFIVLESAQASDAIELYGRQAERIDLVVLDLVMPEM
jgi:CheY-like chemotaxis protein